jgi:hypothetical protein
MAEIITFKTRTRLPASLTDLGGSIDREMRAFLQGDSAGHELLAGLYGDAMDEPVPARLTALLRG